MQIHTLFDNIPSISWIKERVNISGLIERRPYSLVLDAELDSAVHTFKVK
jgi:hypothetical protein